MKWLNLASPEGTFCQKTRHISNCSRFRSKLGATIIELQINFNKRRANFQKHGLDLDDAHLVFNDDAFVIEDPHDDYDAIRYILHGILEQHIVIIAFTVRNDDIIRIISMRKASKREQKSYAKKRFGSIK